MASLVWALILLAGFACSPSSVDASGNLASVEQYPSVAQVEYRIVTAWLQQCVGSVLTSYHILTSASCFSGPGFSLATRRIRAGASNRGEDGLVREVAAVYVHPYYGTLENEADLAVVRLESNLVLGPTIQQTQILGEGIDLPPGLAVDLIGWGTTAQGTATADNSLYAIRLSTVYYNSCLTKYFGRETITENMICAGLPATSGRDLDTRDVGAPLYYSGVMVGIVSFGVSYSDDSYPVVATAVGSYTNWIIETAV